jgi:hypothetical protein
LAASVTAVNPVAASASALLITWLSTRLAQTDHHLPYAPTAPDLVGAYDPCGITGHAAVEQRQQQSSVAGRTPECRASVLATADRTPWRGRKGTDADGMAQHDVVGLSDSSTGMMRSWNAPKLQMRDNAVVY